MAEDVVRIDGTTLRLPVVCGCASSAPCVGDAPGKPVQDGDW